MTGNGQNGEIFLTASVLGVAFCGMAAVPLKEARLFGGCFALKLPVGFVDVSDFRDLPDTQVWTHTRWDRGSGQASVLRCASGSGGGGCSGDR